MKKKGLGRGLDVLLSSHSLKQEETNGSSDAIQEIPIEMLTQGKYQPRTQFTDESLIALAESIKKQGIIQAIVARKIPNNPQYEILAGERRWRAAQIAGLHAVPVIIKEISDQDALAIALIENIQREDLNVIDEANAINRLINEFSINHQEAGTLLGKSRSAISNTLRLLELDPSVQSLIIENKLDMGHARALLPLPKQEQYNFALRIINQNLTTRATEHLVKTLLNKNTLSNKEKIKHTDPNITKLQQNISEQLNTSVSLKHQKSGKGRIIINYHSLDQLDELIKKFK